MNNRQNLLAILLFVSISAVGFSQVKQSKKTDVNKDIDIVRVYEQVVKEGYGTPFIYKKLASAYYFKNEFLKAKAFFEKLFSEEDNTDPALDYQYNQTLKAIAATDNLQTENRTAFN
ncbi:hypothetical protein [Aequorivita echinoideorum]|uniref:Tetratricopeptide repeat-containing protein n=1 Tax=Aequorivita echinoideorum TaxID=1549647 RepID=A0ABS5S0Y5_9FLAO|nr:hypothetical protein [Aequorivita echinoideorum]MBT0606876.1 hypothetical protein [Aequorivita echinoideorum]